MELKRCSQCKIPQTLDCFSKSGKPNGSLRSNCRTCEKRRHKQFKKDSRIRFRAEVIEEIKEFAEDKFSRGEMLILDSLIKKLEADNEQRNT
jgi:hypothetical protein